jgi:hypothetical protein
MKHITTKSVEGDVHPVASRTTSARMVIGKQILESGFLELARPLKWDKLGPLSADFDRLM